jgi:hypothetical protein
VNWLPRWAASTPGLSSANKTCVLNKRKQAEKTAPKAIRFGVMGSLAWVAGVQLSSGRLILY